MYRLLRGASSKTNNVSSAKFGISQSVNYCTLCNGVNFHLLGFAPPPSGFFSRGLNTEELMRLKNSFKKCKKHRKEKKRYTELLEIKADKSNITKATVKTLSPKDVSQLTQKPEISLENLHLSLNKNKSLMLSEVCDVNFKDNQISDDLLTQVSLFSMNDEEWEHKSESEIEFDLIRRNTEDVDMFSDTAVESSKYDSNIAATFDMPVSKKNKRRKATSPNILKTETEGDSLKRVRDISLKKSNELQRRAEEEKVKKLEMRNKNRRFQELLSSYIEACVYCDFLSLALNTLCRYLNKHKYSTTPLFTNPEPFNKLLHGFAVKGNIDKVMEVLHMISSCNVEFNLQTFVGCFECLSILQESTANREKQEIILRQFSSHGFTFQDLFTKGIFLKDQREKILKFIQKIDPNFVPCYEPPIQHYLCSILKNLNEERYQWRSPAEKILTNDELARYSEEQMQIEVLPFQKIDSVVKPTVINKEIQFYRRKWADLENEWKNIIRRAFNKNLKNFEIQLQNTKLCYNVNIYPYLKLLSPEDYVDIVMMEVEQLLRGSETYSSSLKSLYVEAGKKVKLRYDTKQLQDSGIIKKINSIYTEYCRWYLNPMNSCGTRNARQEWLNLLHKNANVGPSLTECSSPWPIDILRNVGKFLYDIIINELRVNVDILSSNPKNPLFSVSAFNELPRTHGKFIREEIKPHPLVGKLYRKACVDYLCFNVELLPMVSPPIPWVSPNLGGYLFKKAHFIRIFDNMSDALANVDNTRLYPIFDSVNQLASVPWRINEPVLDVMIKIFIAGGSDRFNIPRPASSFDVHVDLFGHERKIKKLTYAQQIMANRRKGEMHSLWCEALYRLSLANHYRHRMVWLPHNLDFRGRVYPVPPHLTHIGSDMARALLRFAKGEKLGPKGLDWLKIHCINLTGLMKKAPTEKRLAYANEILPNIIDSATNPLTGKMWWADSEDLWQTLACCMEIKAAIDSGDHENFMSHFPIHQDGSCNGLQHYAALGRDQIGGESVNLTPSPVPQDVYSCVVELVEKERLKDVEQGLNIAKELEGFVERKIIKQTIMTTVYGVTRYGARLQITKQLKDRANFPPHLVWNGSLYLVSKTFHCLREMFTSTRKIQDWLTDCAKVICAENNDCVAWETPLGLPVIQPYMKSRSVTLLNQGGNIPYNSKPNKMKQKSAFPPNFIHSLDSSHMMLTSIMCERAGITFVSVHDCFWTHASSVNIMGDICRKQFVSLHSQPVLEDLSRFFVEKYARPNCETDESGSVKKLLSPSPYEIFERIPDRGTLDLKDILRSEFFFS